METTKQKFGRRVREIRKSRGFKGAEALAEALGAHPNTVYELERGSNWVSPEMLEGLAKVLGVAISAFFEDTSAQPAKAKYSPRLGVLGFIVAELSELNEEELRAAADHLAALGLIDGRSNARHSEKLSKA